MNDAAKIKSEPTNAQNLQVWFCENCDNIHFKTQNVMLDFTKKEFIGLNNAMSEIFENHFDPLEISRLKNNSSADILFSDTIA